MRSRVKHGNEVVLTNSLSEENQLKWFRSSFLCPACRSHGDIHTRAHVWLIRFISTATTGTTLIFRTEVTVECQFYIVGFSCCDYTLIAGCEDYVEQFIYFFFLYTCSFVSLCFCPFNLYYQDCRIICRLNRSRVILENIPVGNVCCR